MVTARRGKRGQRGQALSELVLGLIVFVTVLLFGIHFAEVGFLSLKVQEAATSALWESTAAKMHNLPGKFDPLDNLISGNTPGKNATDRYQDFDGRSSKTGSKAPKLLLTTADGLEVTCEKAGSVSFKPSVSTRPVYKDTGGMRCNAKAELSPSKSFTKSFLDKGKGAFFSVPHYALGVIPVCGMGRSTGGQCQGAFGILLDDWGLAGPEESGECKVLDDAGCGNKPYYDSTKKVYDYHNTVNGSSVRLAQRVVGVAPIDPAKFWMSFRGMDSSYTEKENGGDSDPNDWVTTPGKGSPTTEYAKAQGQRKKCFLGKKDCQ